MSISDIKRSVIPPASARPQQQDLSHKAFSDAVIAPLDADDDNSSFEQELERHLAEEEFNGYDLLGHSIPLGVGWSVLETIDSLAAQTAPAMDIHELNIRLKLKRQEDDLSIKSQQSLKLK